MPTANVNIVAGLVAALLTFVLGAFWYSPILFARQWMQAQGYTPEKIAEMKKRGVTRAYIVSALCYFVMAYVVALLASYTNSTTVVQGRCPGRLACRGSAVPLRPTGTRRTQEPSPATLVGTSCRLAYG